MDDIGARRTLGETALWTLGLLSLPTFVTARLPHKDIAPFLFFMTALAGHIPLLYRYRRLTRVLPVPWADSVSGYGRPPRKIRFNARAAFRLPPAALLSFGLPTAVVIFAANIWDSLPIFIAGIILVWVSVPLLFARIFVRQYKLMRLGDSAEAYIEQRLSPSQHPQVARLKFTFEANGKTYSGEGWDSGYYVPAGTVVPIFYDTKNPKRRLLACESYFEVVEDNR